MEHIGTSKVKFRFTHIQSSI